MSYRDYLKTGGKKLYQTVDVGRVDGLKKVRCSCGSWVFPQSMIDVRKFKKILTNGHKFVCDSCYSTWARQFLPIDAGDNFIIPEEFVSKFIFVKTGKTDAGAEAVKLEYLKIAVKRVMEDEAVYAKEPASNPDKKRLVNERIKIEKRIKKG